MSDSVLPHRRQPTRLPRPWDSPGKNTGVRCHLLLQCMKVKSESEVAQLCLTLSDPWTAAYQAPPSMGFSRQEYWSGVPLPSPPEVSSQSQSTGTDKGLSEQKAFFWVFIPCLPSAQPSPTLSDPMDCSPPGSSVHGILQARALERAAMAFSLMENRYMYVYC